MQTNEGRNAFLVKYNPSFQIKICENAQDCYFGAYPTLTDVKMKYGKNTPQMWLMGQLFNLSEFCGVKDKMETNQIEELSAIISNEFHYLKISELMLFFYRFKSGRYGKMYGVVDPLVISTAIRQFLVERTNAYDAREKEIEKKKREEMFKDTISYEEYCRRIGKNPNINIINLIK